MFRAVWDRTKEYQLSLSSMDLVKGDKSINSANILDELRSDADGHIICHVCSIPHN
jgi:hypothetical protein